MRRSTTRPYHTPRRPPVTPEKFEQANIVRLLRSIGAKVYVLGTKRRKGDYQGTMQTPGIADLEVWLLTHELLKVEVKAAGGRLTPEQREYRELCQSADVHHIVGGLDAVIQWLVAQGYLRENQVGFYHLQREAQS